MIKHTYEFNKNVVGHRVFYKKDIEVIKKIVDLKMPDDEAVKYYHNNPQKSAELLSKELGLAPPEESLKTMKQIVWLDASKQKNILMDH